MASGLIVWGDGPQKQKQKQKRAPINKELIARATMATWQISSKCNNLDRPDAKSRTCMERERETPL
jgi:hypothetical protein